MTGVQLTGNSDPVDDYPEDEPDHCDRQQGDIWVEPERREENAEGEHSERNHRPVGEVDDIHDPPNQGKANGGKALDGTDKDAVEHGGNYAEHRIPRC